MDRAISRRLAAAKLAMHEAETRLTQRLGALALFIYGWGQRVLADVVSGIGTRVLGATCHGCENYARRFFFKGTAIPSANMSFIPAEPLVILPQWCRDFSTISDARSGLLWEIHRT